MNKTKGAATTFSSVCVLRDSSLLKRIKLIVLEGCFDSIESVLCERYGHFLGRKVLLPLIETVCNFKNSGTSPSSLLHDFPMHIPVVFITSRKDNEVPSQNVMKLARDLALQRSSQVDKQNIHTNDVYLLMLNNSAHPAFTCQDFQDWNQYQNFLHAIFKFYQLPYIEEYAKKGEHMLNICRL